MSAGGKWLILRTAGRSTLPLAAFLTGAGLEAWSPAQTRLMRIPRANARRELTVPITPTFVFAKAKHLIDLIELSSSRTRQHEGFSVFHHLGRIPLVDDHELEPLRSEETRAIPRQKRRVFAQGETVRIPEGSFAGMTGIVQQADGRSALVSFGGNMRVRIAAFLLRPDMPNSTQSAALAA